MNLKKSNKQRRRKILAKRIRSQVNYNHDYDSTCARGIAVELMRQADVNVPFYNMNGSVGKFFGMTDDQTSDLYWGKFADVNYLRDITAEQAAAYVESI